MVQRLPYAFKFIVRVVLNKLKFHGTASTEWSFPLCSIIMQRESAPMLAPMSHMVPPFANRTAARHVLASHMLPLRITSLISSPLGWRHIPAVWPFISSRPEQSILLCSRKFLHHCNAVRKLHILDPIRVPMILYDLN
mmetsp:Transcript_40353/g.67043  ORF Transcript_40353/g.67043 Transcript_40353/m.67043 type:complete len:138 (-) Transcript_40353:7-420(-)